MDSLTSDEPQLVARALARELAKLQEAGDSSRRRIAELAADARALASGIREWRGTAVERQVMLAGAKEAYMGRVRDQMGPWAMACAAVARHGAESERERVDMVVRAQQEAGEALWGELEHRRQAVADMKAQVGRMETAVRDSAEARGSLAALAGRLAKAAAEGRGEVAVPSTGPVQRSDSVVRHGESSSGRSDSLLVVTVGARTSGTSSRAETVREGHSGDGSLAPGEPVSSDMVSGPSAAGGKFVSPLLALADMGAFDSAVLESSAGSPGKDSANLPSELGQSMRDLSVSTPGSRDHVENVQSGNRTPDPVDTGERADVDVDDAASGDGGKSSGAGSLAGSMGHDRHSGSGSLAGPSPSVQMSVSRTTGGNNQTTPDLDAEEVSQPRGVRALLSLGVSSGSSTPSDASEPLSERPMEASKASLAGASALYVDSGSDSEGGNDDSGVSQVMHGRTPGTGPSTGRVRAPAPRGEAWTDTGGQVDESGEAGLSADTLPEEREEQRRAWEAEMAKRQREVLEELKAEGIEGGMGSKPTVQGSKIVMESSFESSFVVQSAKPAAGTGLDPFGFRPASGFGAARPNSASARNKGPAAGPAGQGTAAPETSEAGKSQSSFLAAIQKAATKATPGKAPPGDMAIPGFDLEDIDSADPAGPSGTQKAQAPAKGSSSAIGRSTSMGGSSSDDSSSSGTGDADEDGMGFSGLGTNVDHSTSNLNISSVSHRGASALHASSSMISASATPSKPAFSSATNMHRLGTGGKLGGIVNRALGKVPAGAGMASSSSKRAESAATPGPRSRGGVAKIDQLDDDVFDTNKSPQSPPLGHGDKDKAAGFGMSANDFW